MSTATRLMTVAEYAETPPPKEGWYELHHGELIHLARPKHGHCRVQLRARDLLAARLNSLGVIGVEFTFRAEPEYEVRSADIGFVTHDRWNAIPVEGYLMGAPDLVIEILSPSNTAEEIEDKQNLCLANGTREFWIVSIKRKTVSVTDREGRRRVYSTGDFIPLFLGGGSIEVAEIFR